MIKVFTLQVDLGATVCRRKVFGVKNRRWTPLIMLADRTQLF
jgi:hypothetical protein